jgi:nicotinamidase-related amidase
MTAEPAASAVFPRSPELMQAATTCLLAIDLQRGFLAAQPDAPQIVFNATRLLEAAQRLGVTIAATEQAPDKLGETVPEVRSLLAAPPWLKTEFRATACPELLTLLNARQPTHVLVCGIEAHICVQQTALDLLAAGYRVAVAVDAVGSRFAHDCTTALRRIESAGAALTTTEAVLFEWCVDAARPEFKAISALAKRAAPGDQRGA